MQQRFTRPTVLLTVFSVALCTALVLVASGPAFALTAPPAANTSPPSVDADSTAELPQPAAEGEIDPAEKPEMDPVSGGMTPVPGLERDERIAQSCFASTQCSCGNTISCTGSWDCFAQNGSYVECDGNRTNCGSGGGCSAQIFCSSFQVLSCSGTCNRCQSGSDWVYCNGNVYTCDDCPPFVIDCSF